MQLDWAKDVCVEVFREHGLKLSEDDSIILVAAVFRRALDTWLCEHREELAKHTLDVEQTAREARAAIASVICEEGAAFREQLRTDVRAASYAAEQAVQRALAITGRHSQWKHRMEGLVVSLLLFVFGMVAVFYLR